jgi:hypothetical protein
MIFSFQKRLKAEIEWPKIKGGKTDGRTPDRS